MGKNPVTMFKNIYYISIVIFKLLLIVSCEYGDS